MKFDTTRDCGLGMRTPAISFAALFHRHTGRDYEPAPRDYRGRHHKPTEDQVQRPVLLIR